MPALIASSTSASLLSQCFMYALAASARASSAELACCSTQSALPNALLVGQCKLTLQLAAHQRLPRLPHASSSDAIEWACPTQPVSTSAATACSASYKPMPAFTSPPGESISNLSTRRVLAMLKSLLRASSARLLVISPAIISTLAFMKQVRSSHQASDFHRLSNGPQAVTCSPPKLADCSRVHTCD